MARRKLNSDSKIRPFATANINIPLTISVCGDENVRILFKEVKKKGRYKKNNELILSVIYRILGTKYLGKIRDKKPLIAKKLRDVWEEILEIKGINSGNFNNAFRDELINLKEELDE